jgi:hypothetical protein
MVLVCNTPHAVCTHIRFGCVGHVLMMRAITASASGQEISLGASHGMVMLFDVRVALSVSNVDVVMLLQKVYCSRPAAVMMFWLVGKMTQLELQHEYWMLAIVYLDISYHCLEVFS